MTNKTKWFIINITKNRGYSALIFFCLTFGGPRTVGAGRISIIKLADLSNQRVSALVRQLKDDGLVERTEEKRKAYFSKKVVTENEGE